MTLRRIGGLCALICAGSYVFGFALLVSLLAPLGFGSSDIDPVAVVGFIEARPGVLVLWNLVIYVVNALALAVLVVALHQHLLPATPEWAAVTRAFGLIWATLVLGAGMIANVAVERAAHIAPTDPERAAQLWEMLHSVELGLGGGNEIAGGVWVALVSLAALKGRSLGKITIALGLFSGACGLLTVVPTLGDPAGAVFGLGTIAWFVAVGLCFLREGARAGR